MLKTKRTPMKLTLVGLLPIIVSINGCTSNTQLEKKLSPEQINQSVNEWNALQPDVKRLINMEKELVELKSILMKLSAEPIQQTTIEEKTMQQKPMQYKSMQEKKITESVAFLPVKDLGSKTEVEVSTASQINKTTSAIQIGAYQSNIEISAAIKQFYQKFNHLKETTYAYSEPVVSSNFLLRLKIGPFNNFKMALEQCNIIKKAKVDCFPTTLKKDALLVN